MKNKCNKVLSLPVVGNSNSYASCLKTVPPAVYMIVVLVLFYGANVNNYYTLKNLENILIQACPLLVLAFGQTFVILIQGTDLSLGASVSLVTVVWIALMNIGFSVFPAMLIAIFSGVITGLINGFVVAKWKLPPFIATLGMQNVLKSIALLITGGGSNYHSNPIFKQIARGSLIGIPVLIWITVLSFALSWVLLFKHRFGVRIRALGGNPEALTLSGVSINRSVVEVFSYAGLMAGISGIMLASRIESGNPIAGNGWEFNAVAAALLGGSSMREGRGSVTGTVFGVLLITILRGGLNRIGISSIYQNAVIGIVVLVAIIIDAFIKRKQEE